MTDPRLAPLEVKEVKATAPTVPALSIRVFENGFLGLGKKTVSVINLSFHGKDLQYCKEDKSTVSTEVRSAVNTQVVNIWKALNKTEESAKAATLLPYLSYLAEHNHREAQNQLKALAPPLSSHIPELEIKKVTWELEELLETASSTKKTGPIRSFVEKLHKLSETKDGESAFLALYNKVLTKGVPQRKQFEQFKSEFVTQFVTYIKEKETPQDWYRVLREESGPKTIIGRLIDVHHSTKDQPKNLSTPARVKMEIEIDFARVQSQSAMSSPSTHFRTLEMNSPHSK